MDTLWISGNGPAVRWTGTHWEALAFVARRGLGERVGVCTASDAREYRAAVGRVAHGAVSP